MYKVPHNVLQAVINYLTTRPYAEVFQLINALTQLEKEEEEKKKKTA